MKYFKRAATTYVTQVVIIGCILYSGFGLGTWRLETPINCEGDALHYLAVARSLTDGGGWWNIERLSAPFQLPMVMFPFCGTFELGLLKFFSLLFFEPGAVVNATYLASFFLTAFSACLCLRLLGFRRLVGLTVGILYAFLPGAIYRNTAHLMLVYYFVPFAATTAVLLCSDRFDRLTARAKVLLAIGTTLVGLSYIYTAFFGCFFLGVAGIVNWHKTRRLRGMATALLLIVLVGLASLVAVVPAMRAWKNDAAAAAKVAGIKQIYDADMYGLKLRHLLTPRRDHPLAAFRAFANQTLDQFPLENENMFAAMGAFGSVGLIFLLFHILRSSLGRVREDADSDPGAAALLCLAAILLATIGGLGSFFNYFVSTEIRCYNRISVYIAFFSFLGSAKLLEGLFRKRGAITIGLACAALLYLGVSDQASLAYIRSLHLKSQGEYDEAKSFVAQIEQYLPAGAKVYQLPYTPYPNTPEVGKMVSHSHLLAYVVSRNLHWSWPALSGPTVVFNEKLNNLNPGALVATLGEFGFAAVWINTTAYAVGGKLELEQLEAAARTKRIVSSNARYALIALPPTGKVPSVLRNESEYREAIERMRNTVFGAVIDFSSRGRSEQYLGNGWSIQESDFRWSSDTSAHLRFTFGEAPAGDVFLFADIMPFIAEKNPVVTVAIIANGVRVDEWRFDASSGVGTRICRIPRMVFQADGLLELTFGITGANSPEALSMGGDPRKLGIALKALRFEAK